MSGFEQEAGGLEKDGNNETISNICDRTKDLLKDGDFSYDNYIEIVIDESQGSPREFIVKQLSRYGLSKNAEAIVEEAESQDSRLIPLLADPLIAYRSADFLKFAKNKDFNDIKELRREYIESFEEKTYYRGIVLIPEQDASQYSDIAPRVRKYANSPEQLAAISEYNSAHPGLYSPPLLDNIVDRVKIHVFNNNVRESDFFSITEYPEIAWYATSDNGKEKWRSWEEGRKLRVFKFKMNSFYSLPRTEILKDYVKGWKERGYNLGEGEHVFNKPLENSGIELLVPLSMPEGWNYHYEDFEPERDENGNPANFTMVTEKDFD